MTPSKMPQNPLKTSQAPADGLAVTENALEGIARRCKPVLDSYRDGLNCGFWQNPNEGGCR